MSQTGPEIEQLLTLHYGAVARVGGGTYSRVFRLMAAGNGFDAGERIVKVYRRYDDMNELEAANWQRAGLANWVIGTDKPWMNEPEILSLRYFSGLPIQAAQISTGFVQIQSFLQRLHQKQAGQFVRLDNLRSKLTQFQTSLGHEIRLNPLFSTVQKALDAGILNVPACLCHLDLWRANVLFGDDQVLIVDWGRSNWDDPAKDYAILMTGTFDQLPAADAVRLGYQLAAGFETRFAVYVALQTLHDLHWFQAHEPGGYALALEQKLIRALLVLEQS